MRKLKKAIICILLAAFVMAPVCASAATPGSAADPLVTRSWVQQYVDTAFSALQQQVDKLAALVEKVDITLYIGRSTALVNGEPKAIDPDRKSVTPVLKLDDKAGGYTMVPIRFVAESLGIKVEWLSASKQVRFTDGNKTVMLNTGSTDAIINGKAAPMAYPAYIENQRTFVHIRFVAEAFGCNVGWDQRDKRVDITR